MTTTPKVSIIDRTVPEDTSEEVKAQVADTPSREKSTFVEVGKDQWKAMGTPSVIGDMMDYMGGVERMSQYRGPIDALSDMMVINDPVRNKRILGNPEIPDVPDLYKDLFKKNPRLMDDMLPIVERYKALLKTFDVLIENIRYSLKQPMSPLEAQALQKEFEALKYGKADAAKFLAEAEHFYDQQKLREEAAEAEGVSED